METALSLIFLGVALIFILLALLAIVRTGFLRLDSSVGIHRDGIPPGAIAPNWSAHDIAGNLRRTPSGDRWQFLIFVDHGLFGLPGFADALRNFIAADERLEVLILSHDTRDLCEATARMLVPNIEQVPIVPVDRNIYNRFRVRVMPFAFLLSPKGTVRWLGLVNTEAQMQHMWRMGRASELETANDRGRAHG